MNKKYNVIYADCPWNQKGGPKHNGYTVVDGKQVFNTSGATLDLAYPTMSVDEIKSLPVSKIANDDSHLYLWATNASLPAAFEVIKAWGSTYSTTIVWTKNQMGGGLGGNYRINTEFLLFARKGNLKGLKTIKQTWFHVKREYVNGYPMGSKKPEFFRELIESVSPGTKVELFARKETIGWDVFGNEVNNSILLS